MIIKKDKISEIIEVKLKEVSFFKDFKDNPEVIRRIIGFSELRFFKKGATIIKEGDFGDELFIILSGEIDIVKTTLQNQKYVVTSLNSKFGGIYVGELALIDNDRRSATVEAKTDCDCLVLNRDNFIKFGDEFPEIGLHITRSIARHLCQNLRKSSTDVITLFSALVDEISGN